ncbi:hypothetical protein PX52LOC_00316 [Limnoglobus roseus]|uniref:Uncharacterized protein n=1 Tax=Limnoglobus roseus TaxID=2598579 RepID=A0A5C1A2X2_9BACT|nr:hypothetical protein PX52LOC_00316 [Limnoglobus roseus]
MPVIQNFMSTVAADSCTFSSSDRSNRRSMSMASDPASPSNRLRTVFSAACHSPRCSFAAAFRSSTATSISLAADNHDAPPAMSSAACRYSGGREEVPNIRHPKRARGKEPLGDYEV